MARTRHAEPPTPSFFRAFYRALACGASMKGGTTGGGFAL